MYLIRGVLCDKHMIRTHSRFYFLRRGPDRGRWGGGSRGSIEVADASVGKTQPARARLPTPFPPDVRCHTRCDSRHVSTDDRRGHAAHDACIDRLSYPRRRRESTTPPAPAPAPIMPSRATPCLTRPSQRRAYNGRGARQTRDPVWAPRHPHPGPPPPRRRRGASSSSSSSLPA